MSRFARLFVLALAALSVAHTATASSTQPIVAFPAEQEGRSAERRRRLQIGSSRGAVILILGSPDVRAGDDYWVFWDFRLRPGDANPQRFDALVVSFTADVVCGMKLVESRALRRFLSQSIPPLGQ